MKKETSLKSWLWEWHYWAGFISLPFMCILAISGFIYLFYQPLEKEAQQQVLPHSKSTKQFTYQQQLELSQKVDPEINTLILPEKENQLTVFQSGMHAGKKQVWVDPYQNKITAQHATRAGKMYSIRQLHGSLWLGKFGNLLVECIASWMLVLIFTGLYLYFPKLDRIKYLFRYDKSRSKPKRMKNLHSIFGTLFSGVFLLILLGAFPWTTTSGWVYKKIQKATDSGMPKAWYFPTDVSVVGKSSRFSYLKEAYKENIDLTLDQQFSFAKKLGLEGTVYLSIGKPYGFSVWNKVPTHLEAMKRIHFDKKGNLLQELQWKDVGGMMRFRLWVMAFHQGELGRGNWYLVAVTCFILLLVSVTAALSLWFKTKFKRPTVPIAYFNTLPKHTKSILITSVLLMGLILPLFLLSCLFLLGFKILFKYLHF